MRKYLAVLAIFLTLGMGNVGAQYGPAPDQPSQYPSQGQQPYPAEQPPQAGQQYPNAQYPYPSGPSGAYPGQNPSEQNPDYQQNGQNGQYNEQLPPPPPGQQNAPQSSTSPEAQPGVARVGFIRGDVSTQRGDNGEWIALTVNTPLVANDRIATGQDARAEVQLDYANVLRLSDNSTANLANLNRANLQVQIGQGTADFSVLRNGEAPVEIDTPNLALHPDGQGDYRVVVNSNSESQAIVRSGAADIATPQGSTHVNSGQMITVEGTDTPQYKIDPAPGPDEWDSWNADRDRTILSATSWKDTNPYYVGSQDLDQNGTWSEIPDYGPVWTPAEGPDWAPYRDGRWVYEPYYGWTWVSYEPWGWAPYHYGRWFVYGGNWVWWPGPVAAYPGYYPLWAPAYVSFFGFGGGFGIGFGFGRFGWLPCGPGDWFHPWYGGWGARYGAVGVGYAGFHGGFGPLGRGRQSFSTVGEALRNDRVRGGFSSMAGNEFGRGAVAGHQERISAESLRQASMMTGRMPATPTRASYSPTNRAAGTSAIRAGSMGSQRFFSAHNSLSSGTGFNGTVGRTQSGLGANRTQSFGSNARTSGGPSGWQHFNSSSSSRVYEAQGTSRYGAEGPSAGSRAQSYGNSSSRPTLNMRQPIVTQRGESYGGSNNRSYESRTYTSRPYNQGAAPRQESTPRSYSAPSGGYRGGESRGGDSHGGGGGGSSHGGGGGHSGGRR